MQDSLTDIIAGATFGKSYKSRKYSIDPQNSTEHEAVKVWQKSAESSQRSKYINLLPLSQKLASSGEQILTYFLDGSRRVFKVDEIAYDKGIYPIIAGQVSVGCCRRSDRILSPEKFKHEIVIALPEIADPDNKPGFLPSIVVKLNRSKMLQRMGIEISSVQTYRIGRNSTDKLEDKGIACIQTRMMENEKALTDYTAKKLNYRNYLIKDGSLEYSKIKATTLQNYRWVIGISKNFNPELCKNAQGKEDPGYIADLPTYHRTQAACFTNPEILGDTKFAVWYIRLHDRKHTRSAFDGVIKVEKMLVTQSEQDSGTIDTGEIDTISAYILNERMPVCYGNDFRWANHIYPVYLTEAYIKSKYLSTESFLHLF